jgi:P27 family predicted phage terminase small subunit
MPKAPKYQWLTRGGAFSYERGRTTKGREHWHFVSFFPRPLTMPARRKSNLLGGITSTAREDRKPKLDFAERLKRAPEAPADLSPRAAAEWHRLAPAAVGLGTLTAADLTAFGLLCATLATERQAREVIDAEGMSVPTADGGKKPNPAVRAAETARNQAIRLLESFGLTPRGRQSVDVKPRNSPAHDLEEDFWRRNRL